MDWAWERVVQCGPGPAPAGGAAGRTRAEPARHGAAREPGPPTSGRHATAGPGPAAMTGRRDRRAGGRPPAGPGPAEATAACDARSAPGGAWPPAGASWDRAREATADLPDLALARAAWSALRRCLRVWKPRTRRRPQCRSAGGPSREDALLRGLRHRMAAVSLGGGWKLPELKLPELPAWPVEKRPFPNSPFWVGPIAADVIMQPVAAASRR